MTLKLIRIYTTISIYLFIMSNTLIFLRIYLFKLTLNLINSIKISFHLALIQFISEIILLKKSNHYEGSYFFQNLTNM